jgi:hypothetical protein
MCLSYLCWLDLVASGADSQLDEIMLSRQRYYIGFARNVKRIDGGKMILDIDRINGWARLQTDPTPAL